MVSTCFKFTNPEGLNRRITFSDQPTWPLLASKLHVLYGISLDYVGVSYIDNDNDEITLSSDEELQDFYKVSHQAGQVIKFVVVDLHSSQNNAAKPLKFPSLNRDPFDSDAFEFVGEWERLPAVIVTDEDRFKPHAFVEVVSSNNSVTHDDHPHEIDTDTEDNHSTVQAPLLDKGKGRARSFDAASITSVLAEEASDKHPIHVYDLNSRKDDKGQDKDRDFENPSVHIHVAAQSTPKSQAKNVDDSRDAKEVHEPVEVEDPPLPSLDESPVSATSASLLLDLASLVQRAAQVVSSHPELSEGLRNIGRNFSNGTYWTTHREALSNTVNGISNPPSTEERRQAEEAAAKRFADVVGSFFRTVSQGAVDTADIPAPSISENQARGEGLAHTSSAWHPVNNGFGRAFQGMRSQCAFAPLRGSHHHGHLPSHRPLPPHGLHAPGSQPRIPPMPPVYGPHGPHSNGRPSPFFPFHHAPHPVPPPPPPGLPPYHHYSPPTHGRPSPAQPLPGRIPSPPVSERHVPPPPASLPPHDGSPAPAQSGMRSSKMQPSGPSVNDRGQSYQDNSAFIPASDIHSSKPNAQELRAQVEAAKRIYKAEKERYRQEREQRRREKLAHKRTPTVGHDTTDLVAQTEIPEKREISSNQVQNIHPGVERVNLPRRSNTHLGHGPFRHLDKKPEDSTRVMIRIAKRLSDMGFSEHENPALPEKIKAEMPLNGAISKEVEDDIVTTVLEELLATGSSRRLGAWS